MSTTSDHPSGPSIPISYPIKDLDYLESRSYFDSFHYPFNIASVPLPPHAVAQPNRPRLLACHDFKGGYQDDKWVQGGSNPQAYSFWHWHLIDVFVYFSHDMVTLPPPCWTNAAHRHGVKVLGTFILEWEEGRAKSNKLLSTNESAQLYAERLTELATALRFDGWLLNLEIELDSYKIPILKNFISHLTQKMHASVPGSLVIWYDSVTEDGLLDWQNQLNANNKSFFDLCDGIFTNYTWKESYPEISVNAAAERKFDVYMGIDVFGRGTFGDGQWNTYKALDVLKNASVSAALFAFGWVYENNEGPDFETAQNRWWGLVEKSWGVLQQYPKMLPFYANFNQGKGLHYSVEGLQVTQSPWNNISFQKIQSLYDSYTGPGGTPMAIFIDSKGESYNGGGNFTFRGNLTSDAIFSTAIFEGELSLEHPIHISFSVRSDGNSLLGLSFVFSSETNGTTSVLVANEHSLIHAEKFDEIITPLDIDTDNEAWILYKTDIQKSGSVLREIQAVCYLKRPFENDLNARHGRKFLNEDTAGLRFSFNASLGDLGIRYSNQSVDFPPASAWLVEFTDIEWSSDSDGHKTVKVKVMWKPIVENDSFYGNYNIYVEKLPSSKTGNSETITKNDVREFIGAASLEMYYVSDLEVPLGTVSLKFIIQPSSPDGTYQKIDESPTGSLEVVTAHH